jgi:hypothetical protein
MATAYIIHAEGDVPFVKQRLLRTLPSNGYDCWLARHHFGAPNFEEHQAMDECQAILIVLSLAILQSPPSIEEIEIALARRHTMIAVQIEALTEQDGARLPARLWAMPKVDFTVEDEVEAVQLLAALLPAGGRRAHRVERGDFQRRACQCDQAARPRSRGFAGRSDRGST